MSDWDAKTAEWYAEKYGEYATNRIAIDALDDTGPTNVLDIGCGTGAALRHASLRWPKARFLGVDPVPRMVEIAKQRAAGHARENAIAFQVGTAESIPVEDAAFDLVLAFDSLDHWQDSAAGAAEVARVLAPAGRVVVVKDGGVPGHSDEVVGLFKPFGLVLASEHHLTDGEVSCAMWVFASTA